jgi:hypothetical protein
VVREIPLSRGLVALVDDADYDQVVAPGSWYASPSGPNFYARKNCWRAGHYVAVFMHMLITGWPNVDHRNGNGLDNQRANLRRSTRSQNMANRRTPCTNTSGFKGVHWHARCRKWVAQIGANGQLHYLGLFSSPEAAARAYDAAAVGLFGEFARPNFPQETT